MTLRSSNSELLVRGDEVFFAPLGEGVLSFPLACFGSAGCAGFHEMW
jgi:hypothetical protein